jgi:uncharacterized protein YdeI (BOF family)
MQMRSGVQKRLGILFALVFALAAAPVFAQNQGQNQGSDQSQGPTMQPQQQSDIEVDEAELKKFAKAMQEIQQIQQDSNKKIEKAFSDSSMSKKRFNELYQARQSQGKSKAEGETDKETTEYKAMVKQIKAIQSTSQQKMVKAVKNHDLSVQRFNQLVKAIRTDQQLSKRVQQYM